MRMKLDRAHIALRAGPDTSESSINSISFMYMIFRKGPICQGQLEN